MRDYDWLQTPTAIVVWNGKKTYMVEADENLYQDLVNRIRGGNDWSDICALVDPDAFSLEQDEEGLT